jgi:flagellar hook-basal body complex protein FliE
MTSPIPPISRPVVTPVGPDRSADVGRGSSLDQTLAGGSSRTDDAASRGQSARDFAGAIGGAVATQLGQVGRMEQAVTEASKQAAVGTLDSVSDFMIATAEAQLATEITVAVRDRAITAFNDIMRMQI